MEILKAVRELINRARTRRFASGQYIYPGRFIVSAKMGHGYEEYDKNPFKVPGLLDFLIEGSRREYSAFEDLQIAGDLSKNPEFNELKHRRYTAYAERAWLKGDTQRVEFWLSLDDEVSRFEEDAQFNID